MNQHCLILVSGPPGCGKSTLAKPLAKQLKAVLLDKDYIDDPFSPNDRGLLYSKEIEPKVLKALLQLAKINLEIKHHVLLDAPWTHIILNDPEWIDQIQEVAREAKAKLVVLECILSKEILRERISQRGLKRDAVKLTPEGWENFLKKDRIGEKNPVPHFSINMEEPLEICLKRALSYFQTEQDS